MSTITFEFKTTKFDFNSSMLKVWMTGPLTGGIINFNSQDQAEAAFDMITTKTEIPEKDINLLAQMTRKDFAKLFKVEA
jgi:hypothetical protein